MVTGSSLQMPLTMFYEILTVNRKKTKKTKKNNKTKKNKKQKKNKTGAAVFPERLIETSRSFNKSNSCF